MNDNILSHQQLIKNRDEWRRTGKTVVFTNGCFDILHVGHIRMLEKAKQYGDLLILGLNTDSSVRSIKGKRRPIVSQQDRAEVLLGLESVDFVAFFEEETPYQLINLLKPDVLVKGEDYEIDEIVGRDIVEKKGGEVVRISLEEGYSTTNIIQSIKNKFC